MLVQDLLLSRSAQLLLDTSAFIYFLEGKEPYFGVLLPVFRRVQAGELSIIVSVITEAELLVRPARDGNDSAKERIADLLSEDGIYVVGMDRKIARRAAALRGNTRLKLADAIIVATALETGCEAVVGNDGEWTQKLGDIPVVHLDEVISRSVPPAAGLKGN